MSQRRNSPRSDMARGYSQASYGLTVAFSFVGAVIGCWFVGRVLDDWLGTTPWLQAGMSVVGWILGVVLVVYASKRVERRGLD